MIDLFADVPEEITQNTLQTIRRNLDQVGLYGGHTLRKHTDIQILALKSRLTKEDIRYATSYWDVEVANAVVSGIMRKCFDSSITAWLKYGCSDWISLVEQFQGSIGYGFRKGEEKLEENLRKACLVLIKDTDADWGVPDSDQLSHVRETGGGVVKKMKLFVLMAGRYDIAKGAKIHFHLDQEKNLYIASCDQKDFGIVKYLKDGNKKELQMLGTDFDGVILRTDFNQYLAEVAVKREGKAA